jgi:hypothetical protein
MGFASPKNVARATTRDCVERRSFGPWFGHRTLPWWVHADAPETQRRIGTRHRTGTTYRDWSMYGLHLTLHLARTLQKGAAIFWAHGGGGVNSVSKKKWRPTAFVPVYGSFALGWSCSNSTWQSRSAGSVPPLLGSYRNAKRTLPSGLCVVRGSILVRICRI